jgi:hypothetical protein
MKRSTPVMVDVFIKIIVSIIFYYVAVFTVLPEENPFNSDFQGVLVIFIIISAADIIWKLIKAFIEKMRKK